MQQKVVFQDKNYLHSLIESWTINKVCYTPEDLLIFLDETGNPKLNENNPVFGVGGCAFLGIDYSIFVKPAWHIIKSSVFGLSVREPFHASYHLGNASVQQICKIAEFLGDPRIKKVANIVDVYTRNRDPSGVLNAVLSSLPGMFGELAPQPFSLDRWIFEHSDSMSRYCLINMMEQGMNYFHIRGVGATSGGLSFMRKKKAEPGLEISDLIMYLVGLKSREAPNYRSVYDKILDATFDERKNDISERIDIIFGPIWTAPQSDGTSKAIQPPTLTITYLKRDERAERQRRQREQYGGSSVNRSK